MLFPIAVFLWESLILRRRGDPGQGHAPVIKADQYRRKVTSMAARTFTGLLLSVAG